MDSNLQWQFKFWTPHHYWQLNDGSKFLLTIHVLNSASWLTTERRLQICTDKSWFELHTLADNWAIAPNLYWQFTFWTPYPDWQLNHGSQFALTIQVLNSTSLPTTERWLQICTDNSWFELHTLTDNWTMAPNVHWQFKFWTPLPYWQLNDGSKFALTIQVLNSRSLLTTERWLQICTDNSSFKLHIVTDNWTMAPNLHWQFKY